MPWLSVARNVGYALEIAGVSTADRQSRVDSALTLVGLAQHGARQPNELSGGQRQRVALARCLAMSPDVLLLDEPLANLDAHLRAAMIEEFRAAHARTGVTTLYITHDQAEAMALAPRVAVMHAGRIVQSAPPSTLYHEPGNAMVGRFIGRGAIVPATLHGAGRDGIGYLLVRKSFSIRIPETFALMFVTMSSSRQPSSTSCSASTIFVLVVFPP